MATQTYIVHSGDTLSAIAKHHGTTVAKLTDLNGITDANKIAKGQKLLLPVSRESGNTTDARCHIQPLFLDALRCPIEGIHYRVRSPKGTATGTSQTNGLGTATTHDNGDNVEIWAQIPWLSNEWKLVATVVADVGTKLVSLISPRVGIKAPLASHPKDHLGQPAKEESTTQPAKNKHPRGTPASGTGKVQAEIAKGSGKGLHSRRETGKRGITRIVLTQDLPDLKDCFSAYTGEKITEEDWRRAAVRLGCEVAVLKAIPAVETSGVGGFFAHSGEPPIPTILYERHIFSRKTHGAYDATNADLSMPSNATLRKLRDSKKKSEREEYAQLEAVHMYSHGTANYVRFINACLLDKAAAIESCSWGKFQIMGFNWQSAGFNSLTAFLKAAFTSEKAQFGMYTGFIENDQHGALKQAVIAKDWVKIAEIYNGFAEAKTPTWWTRAQKRQQHAAYVRHLLRIDHTAHKKAPSKETLAKTLIPASWAKKHPLAPWVPYHDKLKAAYERIKAEA